MGNTEDNRQRSEEFKQAALPLIQWLAEESHPHSVAIVTSTGVELFSGEISHQDIYDFLKD